MGKKGFDMNYKQTLKELAEAMGRLNKLTIQKNLLEASEYIEELENELQEIKDDLYNAGIERDLNE